MGGTRAKAKNLIKSKYVQQNSEIIQYSLNKLFSFATPIRTATQFTNIRYRMIAISRILIIA